MRRLIRGPTPLLLALACLGAPRLAAAQGGVLRGVVRGAEGAPIAEAVVEARREGESGARTTGTDEAGRFRFDPLPAGRYSVRVWRIGFRDEERRAVVRADREAVLEFSLAEEVLRIGEVKVAARRTRLRFETEPGITVRELAGADLKRIPGLAEADVLRAVESLPGVVSTSDFSAAFNVRGGSADQNLILIDGIPIFNPFHLGGLFSVFNADMVRNAELQAGGFPAEFGGRVSSVLNVESDAGGSGIEAHAGLSLLAARLALGADLPEGVAGRVGLRSGRARISARRSYFDLLLKPVVEFPYHLTDLQLFFDGTTRGGGRITVTGYTGADGLDLSRLSIEEFPLRLRWNWGNDVAGARWTRPLGSGTLQLRGGYSRFRTGMRFPDFDDTRFGSTVTQLLLRGDLETRANDAVRFRTGLEANRLDYDNYAESAGTSFGGGADAGWLLGGYVQTRWEPDPAWLLELGLRGDLWLPRSADPVVVAAPRLAAKRFLGTGDAAVKLALGRYTQFLHSMRDEELPIGIDIWVTAGRSAPHVVSDQVQAGYERFFGGGWSVSLEGFYRRFEGVATTNGAEDPNDPSDDLVAGTGRSYGLDLHLQREGSGGVTGWISASWLRAERTFPDLLSALDPAPHLRYAPIFDRRLDVDMVLRYPLPGGVQGSLRWNFGTGLPFTLPLGAYTYFNYSPLRGGKWYAALDREDGGAVVLGPRNDARYPAYHRLDLGIRRDFSPAWGRLTPYLDILNAYNRRNVLFYFYEYDRDPPRRTGVSMFPVLPTLGLEVAF